MTVIREKIYLRRCRKTEGERWPHRVKFDKVGEGDSLIVEIVFNKKNNIRKCFLFRSEQLSDRKSVAFSVSGHEVYWLRGIAPKLIDPAELPEEPKPAVKAKRKGRKRKTTSPKLPAAKPERRVLVFDSEQRLDSIYRNPIAASKATHVRLEYLEKLCQKKRFSQDTGLSFRYLRTKFDSDDRIRDFSLTIAQYDEMCKRQPKQGVDPIN